MNFMLKIPHHVSFCRLFSCQPKFSIYKFLRNGPMKEFLKVQTPLTKSTLDIYKSNHTGYGQTDGKTRTEVRMGRLYEFVRSHVMNRGVTECQT